ncbi:NACHT domain-containing protein [Nonomuraea sp. NPDC048916]|uniref:NACHT domain-containing protein n=1 Tax=Nonomuraea sp. NPDC048916 TaxID=3154232 RepID=UPI0033D156B9
MLAAVVVMAAMLAVGLAGFFADPLHLSADVLGVLDQRASVVSMFIGAGGLVVAVAALLLQFRANGSQPAAVASKAGMRRPRMLARTIASVTMAAAIGLAVNQVIDDGKVNWSWVFLTFWMAVGGGLLLAYASRQLSQSPPDSEHLEEAEVRLAALVRDAYVWEALTAGLFDPAPLPLRWSGLGSPRVRGNAENLVRSFMSSPVRRLLILGAPGSGKTTLAKLVLLELLDNRAKDDPVPVIFGLSSWDPTIQPFHDWLAARLQAEYPVLAAMSSGPDTARALVARRRILPILDGLDEVPIAQRALVVSALQAMSAPGEPLIITSRTSEFRELFDDRGSGLFAGGLVIELLSLHPADVVQALSVRLPGSSSAGWAALLDALVTSPKGPLAQALTMPWATSLLFKAYGRDGDPSELLDTIRLPDAEAIERHLLDRLVDSQSLPAYAERSYHPTDTRRWLSFLAHYMTGAMTSDLAWWQLPGAVSPVLHKGLGASFGAGLMLTVAIALSAFSAGTAPLLLLLAGMGGLTGYLAASFGRRRSIALRPRSRIRRQSASPRATLGAALVAALAESFVAGLAVAASYELVQRLITGISPGFQAALWIGSVAGLIFGMGTPGFAYLLTVVILAARRKVPFRLMSFLQHAHRIGLLQQVGPVYRFRHLLRDLLAGPRLAKPAAAAVRETLDEETQLARDITEPEAPLDDAPVTAPAGDKPPADVPKAQPPFMVRSQFTVLPPTSNIDEVAQAKICEETLVLSEVLLKIDESSQNRSRAAVKGLVQRLIAANADAVDWAAAAQYERFTQARERLVDAAWLPFWSRPARVYRVAAWLAGGLAGWTAGMWWLPVGTFRLVLAAALVGCVVMSVISLAMAHRKQQGKGSTYGRALRNALTRPLPLLLAGGLVCSFFDQATGFVQVAREPAEPPLLLWASYGAWLVAILLWLSSAPSFQIRTILAARDPAEWLRLPPNLAGYRVAAEQAYQDWIGAMVREGVMPLLRAELHDERDDMSTVLPELDLSRLGGLSRIDEFVATEQSKYLRHLVAKLGSGSVGVSGSRGAGKSTVLRHLCGRDQNGATAHLCLLVHAPTAYDPKDFLTHLFLKVCEEVTGDTGEQASARRLKFRLVRLLPPIAVLLGTAMLAGSLRWAHIQPVIVDVNKRPELLVAALGAILIVMGLAAAWRSSRRRPQVMWSSTSEVTARAHLRSLRYLQAVTQTHSGEVGLPGGGKLSRQSALQRTEQARSYPQLVADLRDLLGQISLDRQRLQGKVIIGIDELDKIGTAEDAERFLNDLKVIFGVHGCYFLVALSEDALTGFERRSLAIRNTFDSAFDTIVRIPPLRSAESRTLLTRRGINLPIPYVWLCHALTGGLPRDLLRATLDLSTLAARHDDHDLVSLAARLIRQDLSVVIGAQLRAAAQLTGDHAPAITEWLAKCAAAAPLTVAALDDLADAAPPDAADEFVVVQTQAYLFILAALSRIFIESSQVSLAPLQAETEPNTIDRIAETRLLLATDPHLAWHTIRRIAEASFLSPVE